MDLQHEGGKINGPFFYCKYVKYLYTKPKEGYGMKEIDNKLLAKWDVSDLFNASGSISIHSWVDASSKKEPDFYTLGVIAGGQWISKLCITLDKKQLTELVTIFNKAYHHKVILESNAITTLAEWSLRGMSNSHASMILIAHDNGDGDGPHWYSLKIEMYTAGDFSSEIVFNINNKDELKKLIDALNMAIYT